MSVIAARVYQDKIVVAADSIIMHGWSKRTANFSKLEYINEMIVGGCGEAQECGLMWRYMQTHRPESPTEKDVLAFLVEFSRWKKDLTGNADTENHYLMAYAGHLFQIEPLFTFEIKDYAAIGAGEDFATAALYLGHSPEDAAKVACELSCYVAEPVVRFEMPREEVKS